MVLYFKISWIVAVRNLLPLLFFAINKISTKISYSTKETLLAHTAEQGQVWFYIWLDAGFNLFTSPQTTFSAYISYNSFSQLILLLQLIASSSETLIIRSQANLEPNNVD